MITEVNFPTPSIKRCSFCNEDKKYCLPLFGTDKLICEECLKKEMPKTSLTKQYIEEKENK